MSYDKYRGLLGDDGYIDYDGILHLIEENNRMKRELAVQQGRIDGLAEIFGEIQSVQNEMQDIAKRLNTLQMQPFFTHKLIAELVEPILRD